MSLIYVITKIKYPLHLTFFLPPYNRTYMAILTDLAMMAYIFMVEMVEIIIQEVSAMYFKTSQKILVNCTSMPFHPLPSPQPPFHPPLLAQNPHNHINILHPTSKPDYTILDIEAIPQQSEQYQYHIPTHNMFQTLGNY